MAKRHAPRRGSMQFWPRKRAKRIYSRIRSWPSVAGAKLLGFAGYKVGMVQLRLRDNSKSPTKGQIISVPATILECPPLKPLSLRFYQKYEDGFKVIAEIPAQNFNKELSRKIILPKKKKQSLIPDKFDRVALQVYTQPKLTSVKKKPEIFEIEISKNSPVEFIQSLLEKEIKISEVFQEGQYLDIHAVTIGRGFQGPVKRFGVNLRQKKSEKVKRGPASLGAWNHQQHIMYRVAHAGQMGFHTRTEYNKMLLKISSNPQEVNISSGFQNYGIVKSDYVIIKGSVPGPKKRLIRLTEPARAKQQGAVLELIQ